MPHLSSSIVQGLIASVVVLLLAACGGGGGGSNTNANAPVSTQPSAVSAINSGDPHLLFTDLISGPDTGLDDGLGSGVIVTVWGQNLGSTQGNNRIELCDSASVCRTGHVYYWKNADGQAPSGPANLYASHGMQEIAFSIPDSAQGVGTIRVTVGGDTSSLPFIVRAGSIFHVKTSGSNSNPGTFAQPWLTSNKVGNTNQGGGAAPAGSTIYFHGMFSDGGTDGRGIYINNSAATAPNATTNFFYVAYPGAHSTTSGREGFTNYRIAGTAISKFRVESSNCIEIANGQRTTCTGSGVGTWGVRGDKWGRVIANHFTDQPGRCSSSTNGAIVGDANDEDNVSNLKILGNEIEEYGCYSSNALHHTTYISIRSAPANLLVEPWEFGWNYLHDNHTKSGIHQFDQNVGCGDTSGPIVIRNNVVINQAGPGIYFGGQCGWSMDAYIENNIVINAGLPTDWDGVNINSTNQNEPGGIVIRDSGAAIAGGGITGTMYIRNNTIHGVGPSGLGNNAEGCLALTGSGDNVKIVFAQNNCVHTTDNPYISASNQSTQQLNNITGGHNAYFYTGMGAPTRALVPLWDTSAITANPLLTLMGPRISVGTGSPLINQSSTTLGRDIYGQRRSTLSNVGAVQ